jgi:hypothetical protein
MMEKVCAPTAIGCTESNCGERRPEERDYQPLKNPLIVHDRVANSVANRAGE